MECINKETETYYTYKMTSYEQLLLTGLLSHVLEGKDIKIEKAKTRLEIRNILEGLSNIK